MAVLAPGRHRPGWSGGSHRHDGRRSGDAEALAHPRAVPRPPRRYQPHPGTQLHRDGDSYWLPARWLAGTHRGRGLLHCSGGDSGYLHRLGLCALWKTAGSVGNSVRSQAGRDRYRCTGHVAFGAHRGEDKGTGFDWGGLSGLRPGRDWRIAHLGRGGSGGRFPGMAAAGPAAHPDRACARWHRHHGLAGTVRRRPSRSISPRRRERAHCSCTS